MQGKDSTSLRLLQTQQNIGLKRRSRMAAVTTAATIQIREPVRRLVEASKTLGAVSYADVDAEKRAPNRSEVTAALTLGAASFTTSMATRVPARREVMASVTYGAAAYAAASVARSVSQRALQSPQ